MNVCMNDIMHDIMFYMMSESVGEYIEWELTIGSLETMTGDVIKTQKTTLKKRRPSQR